MMFNSNTKNAPTFNIYDPITKQKTKTLISCWIKEVRISKDDYLSFKALNLGPYSFNIVWDDSAHLQIAELKKKEYLLCAVSFQKHTYGNFAVIKPARIQEAA